jgi:hypothetical protein
LELNGIGRTDSIVVRGVSKETGHDHTVGTRRPQRVRTGGSHDREAPAKSRGFSLGVAP